MTRRIAVTLLVLGLALGLALLARQLPDPSRDTPMTNLAPEQATRILIRRPDRPDIELARREDGWWLREPEEQKASGVLVRGLLRLLTEARPEDSFPADGADRAEYGLATPVATLRINQQRWRFGDRHPIGERRYVEHDGEIMLLPDQYAPLLRGPWRQFVGGSTP